MTAEYAQDTAPKWQGHHSRKARQIVRTMLPGPCSRCGREVTDDMLWHADHIPGREHLPVSEWLNPEHLRPAHKRCNELAGAKRGAVKGNAAKRAKKQAGQRGTASLGAEPQPQPRPLPTFVPGPLGTPRSVPRTLSQSPRLPGEFDGLPRYFSEPHPEAVASRGDEMVAYAEARRKSPLRWFQWLTAQRRYEVRADGSWCWMLVLESAPRQQGKSVTLAEDAAWYGSLPSDEPELILHAAHRVKTSLKVQSNLWHWAETQEWEVKRLLGDSHILWPDGTDWATIAMESAYGAPAHRLLVDEAWALDPVKFWNSAFPTLGDRENPQVLMWSTANPADHGLVADLRADDRVCRMEWGILDGEDPQDRAVWRASSAYWGPGRQALMEMASSRPGFAEEWLNLWPAPKRLARPKAFPGWDDMPTVRHADPLPGCTVAVDESFDGSHVGVAATLGGEVWYREYPSLAEGLAAAALWQPEDWIVGYSLRSVNEVTTTLQYATPYGSKETAMALPLLLEAVKKGTFAHEHSEVLTEQTEGATLVTTDTGGLRLSVKQSQSGVLGPKLIGWLLLFARQKADEAPAIWA